MSIFEYRPLAFALIEYALIAFILLKSKSKIKYHVSIFIFFLAGYQISEFFVFLTKAQLPIQTAFISTLALHPAALLSLQKLTNKKLGFKVSLIFASILAIMLLANPNLIAYVNECFCIAKFVTAENSTTFTILYFNYYTASLVYGAIVCTYLAIKSANKTLRSTLRIWLLCYLILFPGSILLLMAFTTKVNDYSASFMCALALAVAFLVTFTTIKKEKD